jgi:hypothetical protein
MSLVEFVYHLRRNEMANEMVKVDGRSWMVGIRTELYKAGITEDGEEYSAEQYYIILEKADGERYAHFMSFKGCDAGFDEDGIPYFVDTRNIAMKDAETLLNRIQAKGQVNLQYWKEIDPEYGSLAFQRINRF